MATTSYGATVNAFYLAYYGRPADPAGLAYWTAALQQSNGNFSAIVNAFSTSQEAVTRFASQSVSDRVSDIYQQLFGRAPDKAGLDYWVNTIGSGQLSMADAAIQIMNGAQASDAQTSTLRQEVAAQFTAEVEKTGVAYDGIAAVQAARVLISAVNANSTSADIDSLIKAGASLVQTAHDKPDVIAALADGGDLASVLSTASGKADPVGVVQALASIGKAALSDSAGLSALLQGGSVSDLLNSLPAGTSVKDLAAAVNNGGLYAGAVVASPPPAPEPVVIKPTIAFVGPDGKDLPADTTLVANSKWYFVDIHDKPSGASTVFQISANGTDGWKTVSEDEDLADGSYFIRYVVKDAAGNSGASNALKLVMDHSIPFLNMALVEDTGSGAAGTATDRLSSNGAVKIGGLNANETWYYSFDNKNWIKGTTDAKGEATIADSGATGNLSLVVRTLETVNGKSQFTATELDYTIDKTAPGQGLKLVSVGGTPGSHTDLAKGDVVFSYTGTIDTSKAEALFYRINTNIWSTADQTNIDEVKKTVTFKDVDLSNGPVQIVIQTKDAAGNLLDLSTTVTGPADTTPPAAPIVALVADTGVSDTDHITNNGAIKVSGLESRSTWQYSTDKGATWKAGGAVLADGTASLNLGGYGAQTLLVHATDASGNVSANTTFDYTLYKFLSGYLSVIGKFGDEIDSNTAGLKFTIMATHYDGVTTAYEVSSTGQAEDFKAWDASQGVADGTYYFRATGTDLAGNTYTSNTVTVHLDNTAPPAPTGLKLQQDTGLADDGITANGNFIVSGLEADAKWQFSSDGETWYEGSPVEADGTAGGFAQLQGEQTLQVRTYDVAGNTSQPVSLHFTLDARRPAEGLKLGHIGVDGAKGEWHTNLQKADLVFSYTGSIEAGDVLEYTNFYAPGDTVSTKIDASMIDPVAKTITFHDFDLSSADAYLSIHATSVAGASTILQQPIDGPYTSYFTQTSTAGLNVLLSGQQTAHAYLTGAKGTVQLKTLDASGDLVSSPDGTGIGAQAAAVQGVLGAGNDAEHRTDIADVTYGFGTNAGDTLSGNFIWGFDGDDTIEVSANKAYQNVVVAGGAGADQIHMETATGQLLYAGAQDSSIVADDLSAHGFDTIYVSNGGNTGFQIDLKIDGVKLGDYYKGSADGLTGNETGTALLAALDKAGSTFFRTGGDLQLALIDCGTDNEGRDVNFLAIDTDKDGHIGAGDFVVEIVGSIGTSGFGNAGAYGLFTFSTAVTPA